MTPEATAASMPPNPIYDFLALMRRWGFQSFDDPFPDVQDPAYARVRDAQEFIAKHGSRQYNTLLAIAYAGHYRTHVEDTMDHPRSAEAALMQPAKTSRATRSNHFPTMILFSHLGPVTVLPGDQTGTDEDDDLFDYEKIARDLHADVVSGRLFDGPFAYHSGDYATPEEAKKALKSLLENTYNKVMREIEAERRTAG